MGDDGALSLTRKEIRMKNKEKYGENDCWAMVEAERQYAIGRLENVAAYSIHVIEHLDRIDITVIKRKEGN